MSAVLWRTTIATLVAFAGGTLGVLLSERAKRSLNLLVYCATGVLFAVTLCDILPDAKRLLDWLPFVAAVATGYALFWFIGKYVYHLCPSCAINEFDIETIERLAQSAVLLLIALGIHSTMDGVAVAVSDKISHHATIGVLLAISFHKLPEGLALALLLIGAGYERRKALLWMLGIEATTELGGLLGMFALRGVSPLWLGLVFAHVGGGFLYLVINAFGGLAKADNRLSLRSIWGVSSMSFSVTALALLLMEKYR
jgi:zinc transporter ZupT